jgi:hypothetical protein
MLDKERYHERAAFCLAADYIPMAIDVEVATQSYIERVLRQL